jgi:CxxC motif-containing protein
MLKEYTCIICPNGCEITAEIENGEMLSLDGASCPKGRQYVEQELTDPQRSISSSVLVEDGELTLVSVRLSKPIPKGRTFDVMAEIKKAYLKAPVKAGKAVIENVLGLGSNVITTKNINSKQNNRKD